MNLAQCDTPSLRSFVAHCDYMAHECEEKGYFRLAELFHDAAQPCEAVLSRRSVPLQGVAGG